VYIGLPLSPPTPVSPRFPLRLATFLEIFRFFKDIGKGGKARVSSLSFIGLIVLFLTPRLSYVGQFLCALAGPGIPK